MFTQDPLKNLNANVDQRRRREIHPVMHLPQKCKIQWKLFNSIQVIFVQTEFTLHPELSCLNYYYSYITGTFFFEGESGGVIDTIK